MKTQILRQLGGPLLLFALVSGIFVGGVIYTERAVDDADSRMTVQQQLLSGARAQKANAGLEKDLIMRYGPIYQRLEEVGFIGSEQRLDWVDSLRRANSDALLYGVDYQIGQQEAFPASTVGAIGLGMRQSLMHIRLPLLHEADLMAFFQKLAASRRGVFVITSCTLSRTRPVVTAEQPNLAAECDLNWITVDDNSTESSPS